MSDAAIAHELLAKASHGTLATIGLRPAGHPFASLVAVANDASRPLLLLSSLAEHTKNLEADGRASILLAEAGLAAARVTILGACARVPDAEREAARAIFLAAHPDAAQYVDFEDFGFWRIEPAELRVVVGFGRMSWVSRETFLHKR
ncbi:MAG TPA: pyridoxamine 5'-phosphate oxidase family protein [Labilithrix sp.]|jgi:hypothetical protein